MEKVINPRDIPRSLLEKYTCSGPRYTSYPTAPQFSRDVDMQTVKTMWNKGNRPKAGLSLYTHFPFCRRRCLYCGCFTEVNHSPETRRLYLSSLKKEAAKLLRSFASRRTLRQLALGGGTPTIMTPQQLSGYMEFIRNEIDIAEDAELSLEIDPRTVDENYLDYLIEAGSNRFSFGVQDLDPEVQTKIKRQLKSEHLQNLIGHLRSKGISAVNLDLIYGLPGQDPSSFSKTVKKIASLRPARIALFGYAHVPWVSPHQKALEKYTLPNPEERMMLFGTAFEDLVEAGYRHIGMDHFALPEDELFQALQNRTLTRNFMGYTTQKGLDLLGIGASSISSVHGTYVQNSKDISAYINRKRSLHWHKGIILTKEDLLRREIILELFCNFYLNRSQIEKKWNISFSRHFSWELKKLIPLQKEGLLCMRRNHLEVTPLGRFFIRNICMIFDQYIRTENAEGRYSKTV